jgi:hypothetical protein
MKRHWMLGRSPCKRDNAMKQEIFESMIFFGRQSTSYLDRLTQSYVTTSTHMMGSSPSHAQCLLTHTLQEKLPTQSRAEAAIKQVANIVEIMTNHFVEISHSGCSPRESCVMITSNDEWMRGHRSYVSPIEEGERRIVYIYCQHVGSGSSESIETLQIYSQNGR